MPKMDQNTFDGRTAPDLLEELVRLLKPKAVLNTRNTRANSSDIGFLFQ